MSAHTQWLEQMASFYNISLGEAQRRYEVMTAHEDNPDDPICIGCAKRPHELAEYVAMCMTEPGDEPTPDEVRQFVICDEGTYNPTNGHFLCTPCYLKNGQPSSPSGWRAP